MDPWQRGVSVLARGPGGKDAEYRIKGSGPPALVRLVLEEKDDDRSGRVVTSTAALVPADAGLIGRPERGDTITIGEQVWKVESVMAEWQGWAWRLALSLVR